MNADLCFVPASHAAAELLPAVSGSSGRLLVSRPKAAAEERHWPGQVFEGTELSYSEAMDQFIAARQSKEARKEHADEIGEQGRDDQKAQRRALRTATHRLRAARLEERERRRLVDQAWKVLQGEHQAALLALSEFGVQRGGKSRATLEREWRAQWAQHHQELARRREADRCWRREREQLRQRKQALGGTVVSVWIAVLVLVDNCTRCCLGLPLFAVGAHVTAEMVVEALRVLLPKGLSYLITDGGAHFTADVMKALAKGQGFVRVPLARHRARSNGIAERFIETLKSWLADKEWQTAEGLEALLAEFLAYYNDRPHQGRELAGLSPNEYAARKVAA